jgi:hypothetical protein
MFDKYRITLNDGTIVEAPGRKADAVKFERHFHMPISKLFGDDGIYTEHIMFLGWCAVSRANPDTGDFDAWIETIKDVDIITGEEVPPTEPSSSPSL